jgi:ornithine carbamoyltransferase
VRKKVFANYQVNSELLSHAREDAILMHPLPAHRGEEVTNDVLDGPQSVVFDQAENRLHIEKALLIHILGGLGKPLAGYR